MDRLRERLRKASQIRVSTPSLVRWLGITLVIIILASAFNDGSAALALVPDQTAAPIAVANIGPLNGTNLLQNQGFDAGSWSPWQTVGSAYLDNIIYHSSSYSARLGGNTYATDGVYQAITIPSDASAITIDFWDRFSSANNDQFCYILEPPGAYVTAIVNQCESLSGVTTGTWAETTFSLNASQVAAAAGQTLNLVFQVETTSSSNEAWVDDTALTVTTATPTVTPTPTSAPCSAYSSSFSIAPASGIPGGTVAGTGSCYDANDTVTFRWDSLVGATLGTTPTDGSGAFSNVSITLPSNASVGSHAIMAVDSKGDNASATVTIALPTPTPTSTAMSYHLYLPAIFKPRGSTILVSYPGAGEVVELDRQRNILWDLTGLNSPNFAERLSNLDTLIAETGSNTVIEVTPAGKFVWGVNVAGPLSARMLSNGDILITSVQGGASQILEITHDSAPSVVWSFSNLPGCLGDCWATDAYRLPNGDTLISTNYASYGVVEVDPGGHIVAQVTGYDAGSVEGLDDGNWLIPDYAGKVVEVTPAGGVVWKFTEGPDVIWYPKWASRTSRGTTLIGHLDGLIEVDSTGNIVFSYGRSDHQAPRSVLEVPVGWSAAGQ